MELKNRSFQYGKYPFRTIACMPHLEARRGRYQPSSYVLGPLSRSGVIISITNCYIWFTFLKICHGVGRRVATWNYRNDVH